MPQRQRHTNPKSNSAIDANALSGNHQNIPQKDKIAQNGTGAINAYPRKQEEQVRTVLENELEDIRQLQKISNHIIDDEGSIEEVYHTLLRSIMEMMHADFASLQVFIPKTNQLLLVASENFHPDSVKFWKYVKAGSTSTCGLALANNARVVIEDIEHIPFEMGKGDYEAYRLSGIIAVQSTPLIGRTGKQVGMMSIYWKAPHRPSERELGLYDIVARQVADLIERKKAEEALRENEGRLNIILEGIGEAFYALDPEWRFLFASRSALKMWGKDAEEVFGRLFLECFPQSADSMPYEAHQRVMATGVSERFEAVSPVLNRRVEVLIAPTLQGGLSVSFRDIEDSKRAEEALLESEQKLREFNESLEQQVKDRTTQLTELLLKQKELEESQQQEIFRAILDTQEVERKRIAETLHNSLGQILYAAKLSLGTVDKLSLEETNKESIKNVDKLLNDAITESRRLSHELMPVILEDFGLKTAVEDICRQLNGKTRFKCQFKGSMKRLDKYMEIAIYRLIQELVVNAVRHSGATDALVAIEANQARIMVSVQDNGKGFNIAKGKGGGIGLKTIRNNVSLLNGNIEITSKPGNGTIININIPLKSDK